MIEIEQLQDRAIIILALWTLMIVAVLIDLWTGVDKAKAKHEVIHSKGLRMTIKKISEYWRVLLMALLIDCIGGLLTWYNLPYASMLTALAIILIEMRSVLENLKIKKSAAGKVPDVITEIINCNDVAKAIKLIEQIKK